MVEESGFEVLAHDRSIPKTVAEAWHGLARDQLGKQEGCGWFEEEWSKQVELPGRLKC